MPELPEVEIVRRGVSAVLDGQRVERVVVRQPKLRWPVPADLHERVAGQVLQHTLRRSKYLLLGFGSGTLLVHLGMSGTLRHHAEPPAAGAHDHVDLQFERTTLRYNDPRRFGSMHWSPHGIDDTLLAHPLLRHLGVEPFSDAFDGAHLHRAFHGRTVPVKQALLSGAAVVGVGNIYASESLFLAGIRPTVPAGRLSRARLDRLAAAVRTVLARAIEAGGSTLHDFVASDGAGGCYQTLTHVYGREGLPCHQCGTAVRRIVQQQRATYFCPVCQPR